MKPRVKCSHCEKPLAGEEYAAVVKGRCASCFRASYPNSHGRWCPGCGDVLNSWHPDDGMCESCHGAGIKRMIRPNATQVKHGWWQLTQRDGWSPYNNNSSSASSSKSSKGCFITTATLRAQHSLDDKHPVLQKLRAFRDEYILDLPNGKAMVEEYYEVAPRIVCVLDSLPESAILYLEIFSTYIKECVNFIDQGQCDEAVSLYETMVKTLSSRHLEIEKHT